MLDGSHVKMAVMSIHASLVAVDGSSAQSGSTMLWGGSYPGNGEYPYSGARPQIYRRFFQDQHWGVSNSWLETVISDDLQEGAVCWISTKPPGPWDEVAAGDHGAWANTMFDDIAALPAFSGVNNPDIWFTFHHEPDGGGGSGSDHDYPGINAEEHYYATQHLRSIADSRGDVDFLTWAPILMEYSHRIYDDGTDTNQRDPDRWWPVSQPVGHPSCPYDFYGIDWYPSGTSLSQTAKNNIGEVADFATARNALIGVAEWGDDSDSAQYIDDVHAELDSLDCLAACYFDVDDGKIFSMSSQPNARAAWQAYL